MLLVIVFFQFKQENEQLYNEMNSTLDEVRWVLTKNSVLVLSNHRYHSFVFISVILTIRDKRNSGAMWCFVFSVS